MLIYRLILLATAILALARLEGTRAATFYADPVSGNISNDGSQASPWPSLEEVSTSGMLGNLNGGDTLYLLAGSHNPSGNSFRISGIYQNPGPDYIVIEGMPGNVAVINSTLVIQGCRYITIRGLRAYSIVHMGGGRNDTHHIRIENNLVGPNEQQRAGWTNASIIAAEAESGIDFGAYNTWANITNNHIAHVRIGIIVLVEGNIVEHIYGDGYRVAGSRIGIINNEAYGFIAIDDYHKDMIQVYAGRTNVYDLWFRNNRFFKEHPNVTYAYPTDCQGIGSFDDTLYNVEIENNLVVTEHWNTICFFNPQANVRIIGNTVFNPNWENRTMTNRIYVRGNIAPGSYIIKNNIGEDFLSDFSSSLSYKDFLSNTSSPNFVDNLFVDWRNHDFRLKIDSGARGLADSSSPAPLDDNTGQKRGTPYDLGAFNYVSDTTSPVVPPCYVCVTTRAPSLYLALFLLSPVSITKSSGPVASASFGLMVAGALSALVAQSYA